MSQDIAVMIAVNPFSTNVPPLYPLLYLQHLRFSDIFRGYKSRTLVENGLSKLDYLPCWRLFKIFAPIGDCIFPLLKHELSSVITTHPQFSIHWTFHLWTWVNIIEHNWEDRAEGDTGETIIDLLISATCVYLYCDTVIPVYPPISEMTALEQCSRVL